MVKNLIRDDTLTPIQSPPVVFLSLAQKRELCTLLTKPWITCPLTSHLSPNAPSLSLRSGPLPFLVPLNLFYFFFESLQFPLLLPSHRYSSILVYVLLKRAP